MAAVREGGHRVLPSHRCAGFPGGPSAAGQIAVTRRCAVDNSVIGAGTGDRIDEALKAITIHAARHIGLEDSIGTLEPGKEADLTILESDPYKADPEKISAIKVSETWVAGEQKFGMIAGFPALILHGDDVRIAPFADYATSMSLAAASPAVAA